MRSISRVLFTALIALAWTTAASAEVPGSTPSVEPETFASLTVLRLEREFEKSAASASDSRFHGLAGPTTMNCSRASIRSELETCVVTVEGTPRAVVPATLAVN
jgi:hypothetical protein